MFENRMVELLRLVMEINAHDNHCAFYRYYGHVEAINVSVAKSKKEYNDTVFDVSRYGRTASNVEEIIGELKRFMREEAE